MNCETLKGLTCARACTPHKAMEGALGQSARISHKGMTIPTTPVCLSLVAFFASGPYLAFVMGLLMLLFLSVAVSHTMNDDIPRDMAPWLRSWARQDRLVLLRCILLLVPITLLLFLFGFWW